MFCKINEGGPVSGQAQVEAKAAAQSIVEHDFRPWRLKAAMDSKT
jgi:hypothetical protein